MLPNKALQPTVQPLRGFASAELERYTRETPWKNIKQ